MEPVVIGKVVMLGERAARIPCSPAGDAEGLFPLGSALSSIPWIREGLATPSAEVLSLPVML